MYSNKAYIAESVQWLQSLTRVHAYVINYTDFPNSTGREVDGENSTNIWWESRDQPIVCSLIGVKEVF